MDFEELSQSLDLSSDFLRLLTQRFAIDNELDLIRLANEASQVIEEVGEDADEEDVVEFMAISREVNTPQFGGDVPPDTQEPQQEPDQQPVNDQAQDTLQPTSPVETAQEVAQTAQSQQPIQESASAQPQARQEPQRATVTQTGEVPEFQYNDPRATGKSVRGSTNQIINEMFGTDTTISQDYANYNPSLEPRSGVNWGTDFVPVGMGAGAPMKNPFGAELRVIKVVDGFGSGGVGRFDQNGGYGNQVVVQRSDTGEILKLNHLQKGIGYKSGDVIQPGEQIARMGQSGNVTGAHLDIEVFDPDGRIKDVASLKPPQPQQQEKPKDLINAFAQKQESLPQPQPQPLPQQSTNTQVRRIEPQTNATPEVRSFERVMDVMPKPQQKRTEVSIIPQSQFRRAMGGGTDKKTLNKPIRTSGENKSWKVYVKDPDTGNIKTVRFGDPNMKDRSDNPEARKSFRARHNCDNPGPKTKARYWSCKKW